MKTFVVFRLSDSVLGSSISFIKLISKHSSLCCKIKHAYTTVQSVHITTKGVSSNPAHGEVYSMQHFEKCLSVTCDTSVVVASKTN